MSIQNIRTGDFIYLLKERGGDLEIIDVRDPGEFNIISVKGSNSIPLGDLSSRLGEIDWSKDVIFLCRSGVRSRMASEIAATAGKNVKNLEGGIKGIYSAGANEILRISKNKIGDYF